MRRRRACPHRAFASSGDSTGHTLSSSLRLRGRRRMDAIAAGTIRRDSPKPAKKNGTSAACVRLARRRRTAPRIRARTRGRSSAAASCRSTSGAGARLADRRDHRVEVVLRRREIAAAQAVVAAQLDDRRSPACAARAAPAGARGRPAVVSPVMLALTTRHGRCCASMRAASRSTQPVPLVSPYPAEIESPTTSSTGAPVSARAIVAQRSGERRKQRDKTLAISARKRRRSGMDNRQARDERGL